MKRYLVSICIPLVANDLVSILAGCISCLENYLFFAHFKIGFFVFIFTVKISYIFYLQVSYQINYVQKFSPILWVVFFNFFKLVYFLERGEGKEKERKRNINVWLPLTLSLLGTWPATQACALTENSTGDPLVHRLALNPLSYTSQGDYIFFL